MRGSPQDWLQIERTSTTESPGFKPHYCAMLLLLVYPAMVNCASSAKKPGLRPKPLHEKVHRQKKLVVLIPTAFEAGGH